MAAAPFLRIVEHLEVEHGFHEQDVGHFIRLLLLVLGEQRVEFLEFRRQVGFGLLALFELGLDFGDQVFEFSGDGIGVGGQSALVKGAEREGQENDPEQIFHNEQFRFGLRRFKAKQSSLWLTVQVNSSGASPQE